MSKVETRPSPARGRISTDPRISRRRKAVERSKRKRLIASVVVVAMLATGLWAAFWSPLLHIEQIDVNGARRTTHEEVEKAAALAPDDNLLLVSTGDIAGRIAELPWVRDVEVDRKLPGTITVRIGERKPALLLSVGAATWTIDGKGNVLAPGDVGAIEPGERLKVEEGRAALRVWRSLPRSLEEEIAGLFAPTLERITFSLADGTLVRYGAAEDLEAKNEVLHALLDRIAADGQPVAYIDVRVPTNAAVAPLPDASVSPSPTPSV